MMEGTARQLDVVRDEMVRLLQDYPYASDRDRVAIYERCEELGGEIQELIGLLKFAIRKTRSEAEDEAERDPEYWQEISRLSQESLTAIHDAGLEVAAAITLLRDTQGVCEEADYGDDADDADTY